MGDQRSTIGVVVAVVAALVAALTPAGGGDCAMCTTSEFTLLGAGATGVLVGTWMALDDRRWWRRILPSVGFALVASAGVYAVRLALTA